MPSWADREPFRTPPAPRPQPRPFRSIIFDASCPSCGHQLEQIAGGRPDPHIVQTIVNCPNCHTTGNTGRYRLTVALSPVR